MKKIAIGGFLHESNSFAPALDVDFTHFATRRDRPPLVRGAALFEELAGTSFCMAGFLRAVDPAHQLAPLVWASGGAGGKVLDEAFERIAGEMVAHLRACLPVDAVYLELHGAMVTPTFPDAEGELLRRVREVVGAAVPVVITLDYHANVSPEMVRLADAMVAFRTYPHVDRVEIGELAARVTHRLLKHGRPAGRAVMHAPFLVPLQAQCTLVEPSSILVAGSLCDRDAVAAVSYVAGFPAGDTRWSGPAFIAHADTQARAEALCRERWQQMVQMEAAFDAPLWTVPQAVAHAMRASAAAHRPVILADIQDNPGAGASSDSTGILRELLRAGARQALIGFLYDPEAAAAAHAVGVGGTLELALGGRHANGGQPLQAVFGVERLGDGRFVTTGRVAGGNATDLGPMALLSVGGVNVVVTSRRMQAFDEAPFRHLGVDVRQSRILVLKSTCHFRADFAPLAHEVLCVLAPADHLADPGLYPYQHLRDGVRLRPAGR